MFIPAVGASRDPVTSLALPGQPAQNNNACFRRIDFLEIIIPQQQTTDFINNSPEYRPTLALVPPVEPQT